MSRKSMVLNKLNKEDRDYLINMFKKYHRYGEIKFAIDELEHFKRQLINGLVWVDVGFVLETIDQQINGLREQLNENKN